MDTSTLKQAEIFAFLAALFLIAIMFSDNAKSKTDKELSHAHHERNELVKKLEKIKKRQQKLIEAQKKYIKKLAKVKRENPPIIILSEENEKYRFRSGSAKVSKVFLDGLTTDIIPTLKRMSEEYNCDTIEIVGHTDSQPLKAMRSTLDTINQKTKVIVAGSNLDLGMMRAISVLKIIQTAREKHGLKKITYVLPYSAGQFIRRDASVVWGSNAKGEDRRRRIEIRLRRSVALQKRLKIENAPKLKIVVNQTFTINSVTQTLIPLVPSLIFTKILSNKK